VPSMDDAETISIDGNEGSNGKTVNAVQANNSSSEHDHVCSSQTEREIRIQLAACYRLFWKFGWNDHIFNHITARIPNTDYFLINPFGLLWNEINASSFVKVDSKGNVVDPGTTSYGINFTGYVIHSAIHRGRPDIMCIAHCHEHHGVAVSGMAFGLLPFCQDVHVLGEISYHDYQGVAVNLEEQESLIKDLGAHNMVMILRNHGLLTCGRTIAEAFELMHLLIRACKEQVLALSAGRENITIPSIEIRQKTYDAVSSRRINTDAVGKREFDAYIRLLDKEDVSYKE